MGKKPKKPKRAPRPPKNFTATYLDSLKPEKDTYEQPDLKARGLRVVVWPSGKKSFIVRYRRLDSKVSAKLSLGWIPLTTARKAAGDLFEELRHGRDPGKDKKDAKAKAAAANADTVQAVCAEYMKRAGANLRTHKQRERIIDRLICPALGSRPISKVTELDCIRLFDRIADDSGPVMADYTRAILSRIFAWHRKRDRSFVSPILRDTERHAKPPHERARTRTLDDNELRRLWKATEGGKPFSALVRFLLLTGARLSEGRLITRAEVVNGDWLLPSGRNKVKRELLRPLSPQAREILDSRPVVDGCPYYFTADGYRAVAASTRHKKQLDEASGVFDWRLHDLRRTARSLMSKAGVAREHAEECLGHTQKLMVGTYDRYDYCNEKKRAFERLATQLELIVNQPDSNVVVLRG
jgi:integrase